MGVLVHNRIACKKKDVHDIHDILMIFMAILTIFIIMDNGNGASSPHGFQKIGGQETKV